MNVQKGLPPWSAEKRLKWFLDQRVRRSYADDVLARLEASPLAVETYGNLTIDPARFPLHAVRVGDFSRAKKTVLITGGVHGYETSGVKGALLFLEEYAAGYTEHFNFVVVPCVSPWSYETVNRLNPVMENPNREFVPEGKAEESRLLMRYLNGLGVQFDAHLDLHETTNSDRVFLPEEYAKNGLRLDAEDIDIPDGFYLIGIDGFARPEVEKAMLDSVRNVTHLAKPDGQGRILDIPLSAEALIHKPIRGLCAEYTEAKSRLGAHTTEMYPDSPRFAGLTAEAIETKCNEAQVACIEGALKFWRQGK